MEFMLTCASHSPLIYFPAAETEDLVNLRSAIAATRARIQAFDPQLIVLIGCDHYGGMQMASMPAFCVGVEATAIADVGGTPGKLNVPPLVAVAAVNALREHDVDIAVSYAMAVDHGFSQILKEFTGSVDTYPVLPVFVCCLQPPFVPFKRARALGIALADFARSLPYERVLILGTGGLSHDPSSLFPPIDTVPAEWRPYILHGKTQTEVPQQAWLDFEIAAHQFGAKFLVETNLTLDQLSIRPEWDKEFLAKLRNDDLRDFDQWQPETVVLEGGFGAMEVLTWVAATQMMERLTSIRPETSFHAGMREIGIGFGIAETKPALSK